MIDPSSKIKKSHSEFANSLILYLELKHFVDIFVHIMDNYFRSVSKISYHNEAKKFNGYIVLHTLK